MIYDCFIFFNEIDLLDIRLHELNDTVDKFVIVESNITFSGKAKEYIFEKNIKKFSKFLNKIIYIKLSAKDYPKKIITDPNISGVSKINPKAWTREIYQRNSILLGLKNATKDDLILIGDIDEIPNPSTISNIKHSYFIKPKAFQQKFYYYYLNCLSEDFWIGTKAIYKNNLTTPQELRTTHNYELVKNAGWHFSFLGGFEKIKNKIYSFSHQEFNTKEINNINRLQFNIENNLDIFDRPIKFSTTKIDHSYPKYILTNIKKYKSLIKKYSKQTPNTINLQNEIYSLRKKLVNNHYIDVINKLKNDKNTLSKELNEIKNSEFFKLWPLYCKIKKFFSR